MTRGGAWIEVLDVGEQFGARVLTGRLRGGDLGIGDEVEWRPAAGGAGGRGMVCGLVVEGQGRDRALAEEVVQLTLRGEASRAGAGDRLDLCR